MAAEATRTYTLPASFAQERFWVLEHLAADEPFYMHAGVTRVRGLLAVRRDGVLRVPADLVANDIVLKHLPGVLTLLRDAGYNDEEALRWLYTPDDTLPGTPAQALGGDLAREVKRRAQALAF